MDDLRYDAGYLNDFGGGYVEWWHDYLRAELERSHDYYSDAIEALQAQIARLTAERDAAYERAAEVAERMNGWGSDCGRGGHAEHIAAAIRAMKDAPTDTPPSSSHP